MAKEPILIHDYWKDFWQSHAKSTVADHLQRQVLRTLNKKPIAEEQFHEILKYVKDKIKLAKRDDVLDLCCGNGLITTFLASCCKSVIGVDFAEELISQINLKKYNNISIIVEDIRRVSFEEQSFDKVVLYAGLQYLSYKETVLLFERVMSWLRTNGLFLIADIPDRERMWGFFNSEEREKVYFDTLKNEKPIVGTWFDRDWLVKLGRYVGFKKTKTLSQPKEFPYAHYRFDLLLKK